MIKIMIPQALTHLTAQQPYLELKADTVSQALNQLVETHEGIKPYLFDEDGQICTFMSLYLNNQDIRQLDNQATVLKAGDELSLVPAIAGG